MANSTASAEMKLQLALETCHEFDKPNFSAYPRVPSSKSPDVRKTLLWRVSCLGAVTCGRNFLTVRSYLR
jgi:hypothetical protein